MNEIEELPRLTKTEALILRLLLSAHYLERYGFRIIQLSGGQLKRGTVYVLLNRLRDKKFVESSLEPNPLGEFGKSRRLYTITGLGLKVLEGKHLPMSSHN